MAGFGVAPGDLTKVAGQYETHGGDIIDLKSSVTPGVGAGQVGRHFKGTETRYKAYFDRLQASIETFGREANNVATRLKDVAAHYEKQESENADSFKGK
jgi:hypothetical protein